MGVAKVEKKRKSPPLSNILSRIKLILPSSSIFYFFAFAFSLLWAFYINPNFLDALFKEMTLTRIEDLSKTLIETTGFLISFLAVAGFYYLSKIDESFRHLLSSSSKLFSRVALGKMEMEKLTDFSQKGELKLKIQCDECKKDKQCEIQKQSIDLISSNKKLAIDNSQGFKTLSKTVEDLANIYRKIPKITEGAVMYNLVVTIVLFFLTIISSTMAYVTQVYSWLQSSVFLIIFGIVWIIITWVSSYLEIRWIQEHNWSVLEMYRDTNLLISSTTAAVNRIEFALGTSTELICNTIKAREKTSK
jgi:hypothetical protein